MEMIVNNLRLNLLSKTESEELYNLLKETVYPPTNRVLIATPKLEGTTTRTGLYLPANAQDSIPQKGVIILMGDVSKDDSPEVFPRNLVINPGVIVTFGRYGGKEVSFQPRIADTEVFKKYENQIFTILSITEIMMFEEYEN
jgi:co-chaperonin GroES (HSP10)